MPGSQAAPDRAHKSPGRQSLHECRCADEVSVDSNRIADLLGANLFDAPDLLSVYVEHLGPDK